MLSQQTRVIPTTNIQQPSWVAVGLRIGSCRHRNRTRCLSYEPGHEGAMQAEGMIKHRCSSSSSSNSSDSSRRVHLLQLSSLTAGAFLASTSAAAVLGLPSAAAAAGAAAGAAGSASSSSCSLVSSSSGLQWCDLAVGEGAAPIKGAFTKAHYTAKLASNGVVFDSSYQRKTPLIFKVGEREVIEAFDVAVLGAEDIPAMREGGRRLVVAPPGPLQRQGTKSLVWMVGMLDALEDAGELSAEGTPTSDLVFEIELLAKRKK